MSFTDENGAYRRFNRIWHVTAALAALAIGYIVSVQQKQINKEVSIFGTCIYSNVLFLGSWGLNFGASTWVIFVAGFVMLKTVDRHTFGKIQGRLFPIYFFLSGFTSLLQLCVILFTRKTVLMLPQMEKIAAGCLLFNFFGGFLNGLWFGPKCAKILLKRAAMEREEGVMPPNIGSRLGENPTYKAISKEFGKYHGISVTLNLISFAGSFYVIYFVALEMLNNAKF